MFNYSNDYEQSRLRLWDFMGSHFGEKNGVFYKDYRLCKNHAQLFKAHYVDAESNLKINGGFYTTLSEIQLLYSRPERFLARLGARNPHETYLTVSKDSTLQNPWALPLRDT